MHSIHHLCKVSSILCVFLFLPEKYIMHWDAKKLFQVLPFYNTFIERPEIKKLSIVESLKELPFYDELNIVKNNSACSGYARSYKIEIDNFL